MFEPSLSQNARRASVHPERLPSRPMMDGVDVRVGRPRLAWSSSKGGSRKSFALSTPAILREAEARRQYKWEAGEDRVDPWDLQSWELALARARAA